MKVTFLGTGTSQGIPMILSDEPVNFSTDTKDKRMRSSVYVEVNEKLKLLIDCGADFRQQILENKINQIDAVLFTHEHSDHIAGLDDIRPFCYKNGPMPLYAMRRVMDALAQRYAYIFATENRYPGAAAVIPNIISNDFNIGVEQIRPIKVDHGNLPILGYRIGGFTYLSDVKSIPVTEYEKLKNVDVLVVNALRIEEHPTHFNLQEALDFVEQIQPKKAYFTHISHRLGFHKEVSEQLPNNVFLAYDGLILEI